MKLDKRTSLNVWTVLCLLALSIVIISSASRGDIPGHFRGGDGDHGFNVVKGHTQETTSLLSDLFGNIANAQVDNNSAPTPTVTPVPSTGAQTNGQVKQSHATYNMYPIIQMNLSWKRASKNEPITFDSGDTYDPDGYIVTYEWTFGDGSTAVGHTVQHAFHDVGKYAVRLRVVDNSGAERSAYVTAIISNRPPVAIPGNDTNATIGEKLQLSGLASYDPDGKIVKYEWSFGDGTFGQGVNVTHAYDRPDKYKVELKVTDDDGSNSTGYIAVNVDDVTPTPVAAATSGGLQGMALLAGAGIACVAVMVMMRKRSK